MRAEQAELLLAQTQRSQEEQLRAARLEESTRIAREIHDVLAHALQALVYDYEGSVSLAIDGAVEQLSGPEALAVLRCVQESMTNVRKHAPGASVNVSVTAGADGVTVVVRDHVDGSRSAGESDDSGGGYGLQGMRERAESLGGTLTAGPVPEGWRVELRLPAPPP